MGIGSEPTVKNDTPPTLERVPDQPDIELRGLAEAESDRMLVERTVAGDERAFAALLDRYGQPISSLCYASTLDRSEAEDLTQEIFLTVWRKLGGFRGESAFSTWLFAIARNACIDHSRRRAARPKRTLHETLFEASTAADNDPSTTATAVFELAATLSEPLRQALLLRDVQGLSYDEIAVLQDVPVGTVRSRIANARLAIIEGLEQ